MRGAASRRRIKDRLAFCSDSVLFAWAPHGRKPPMSLVHMSDWSCSALREGSHTEAPRCVAGLLPQTLY